MSEIRHLLSWHDQAACRTADPALFFPEHGDYGTIDRAVAVCNGCPVRVPCRDDALTHSATHGRFGIRGGLTEHERRALRRNRRERERRAA